MTKITNQQQISMK